MAIRVRKIDGIMVALCAARSVAQDDDIYLDDEIHQALSQKFANDFNSMLDDPIPVDAAHLTRIDAAESNNVNRIWWDKVYGA